MKTTLFLMFLAIVFICFVVSWIEVQIEKLENKKDQHD